MYPYPSESVIFLMHTYIYKVAVLMSRVDYYYLIIYSTRNLIANNFSNHPTLIEPVTWLTYFHNSIYTYIHTYIHTYILIYVRARSQASGVAGAFEYRVCEASDRL